MRIRKLVVKKLFGIFDYEIPLNINDGITIIHGPNGFGKTAILRLVSNFFNAQYEDLEKTSFDSFIVELDNNSRVEVIREIEQQKKAPILFKFYDALGEQQEPFSPRQRYKGSKLIAQLESNVPGLERLSTDQWMDRRQDELLTSEEAIRRYLPRELYKQREPLWLQSLKKDIPVRLIESQRLLNFEAGNRQRRFTARRPPMLSTVSAYSDELAGLMQEKFKEYGTTSQSLDSSFPLRIMQGKSPVDVTEEQLRNQLNTIENTRSRLIEVGLLDKEENYTPPIQPQNMDTSTRNTLSIYVEDVEKKLGVFEETAKKIDLLRRIINRKFSYSRKEMNFSKEKGFVFETHYSPDESSPKKLSPNDLSSGEQHELVLLYELLFKVKPDFLVLIDEPELSLHVTWQSEFLNDLQEIMSLTNISVLMATHSPDIIQDRWDLTVSLAGDNE